MAEVKNPDASETASEAPGTTGEKISGAAGAAREKISGAASGARRRVTEAGDSVKSAASGAKRKFGDVKSKVSSADYAGMSSELRVFVRENPGKAIVVAAATGFLVGLLLRSSEE